jgi:hypothetical protein
MVQGRSFVSILVFCVLLAGCAGGRSTLPGLGGGSAATSAKKQHVTLKIDVPKRSGAGVARHPQYVSPATAQVAVNLQTGCPGACAEVSGYPTTVALTTSSGNCTSTLASTNCTLTILLSPGSYTLTMTTKDGSGNALSTAQSIPVTVNEGQANAISVTLSGIPTQLIAALYGQSGEVLVEALDADGNIIVGPGAPSYTAASTGGESATLTQPTAVSPNIFAVSLASAGTADISITAGYSGTNVTNACTQSGAVCTASVALTASAPPLFFADFTNNVVDEYASPYTGSPTAITTDVSEPSAIAVDSNNDLFVANAGSNYVREFAAPYTSLTASMSASCAPVSLATDANNDVYVAERVCNAVYVYAPPYTGSPVVIAATAPSYVTIGPNGDLFVINNLPESVNTISVFTPPFSSSSTPAQTISVDLDGSNAMAVNSIGQLFVTNGTTDEVNVYLPPYTGYASAPYSTVDELAGTYNGPYGLAIDAAGDVFVANGSGGSPGVVESPGDGGSTVNFSTDTRQPQSVAVSAYGVLAVMNFSTSNALLVFTLPSTSPTEVNGPEGDSDAQGLAFASPVLTLTQL